MTLVCTCTAQGSGMTENFHPVCAAFPFTILMRKEWSRVSSFLLLYANTAGICPENCLSSLLQSWSYSLTRGSSERPVPFARINTGYDSSLLCGVSVFFSDKAMEHRFTEYCSQNTLLEYEHKFKPLVFIVGYFFPCTSAIRKINLG